MKKILIVTLALALVLSLSAVLVSAATVSEDWSTTFDECFTLNDDGNLVIKGKGNIGLFLNKEITGDFTLEFQANSTEIVEGTDQKFTLSLFADNQEDWMSGYWFRLMGAYVQLNDGTDTVNAYREDTPGATCTVNVGAMNDIKVEYKGGKLTYYVNGTNIGEFTPADTTGKYISIGANYAGDESLLTQEFTVKGLKLTMGGETLTYFGEAEELENPIQSEPPVSSETTSSGAVSSTAPISKPSVSSSDNGGGCGNKAE